MDIWSSFFVKRVLSKEISARTSDKFNTYVTYMCMCCVIALNKFTVIWKCKTQAFYQFYCISSIFLCNLDLRLLNLDTRLVPSTITQTHDVHMYVLCTYPGQAHWNLELQNSSSFSVALHLLHQFFFVSQHLLPQHLLSFLSNLYLFLQFLLSVL